MLVLDARFEIAIDRLEEVLAVKAGVKAEDGAAEHALENLAPPRADSEGFRIRPGNVPEREDRRLGQLRADHRRHQREVIVLHQHDRIVAAGFLHDRVGEALVDCAIGAQSLSRKIGRTCATWQSGHKPSLAKP